MLKTNIVRHGLGIGAIYKCGREIMETNRSITLQSTTLYMAAPPPFITGKVQKSQHSDVKYP